MRIHIDVFEEFTVSSVHNIVELNWVYWWLILMLHDAFVHWCGFWSTVTGDTVYSRITDFSYPRPLVPKNERSRDTCRFRVLIGNYGAVYFNAYTEPYNHAHSPVWLNTAKDHKGPQRTITNTAKDHKGLQRTITKTVYCVLNDDNYNYMVYVK